MALRLEHRLEVSLEVASVLLSWQSPCRDDDDDRATRGTRKSSTDCTATMQQHSTN